MNFVSHRAESHFLSSVFLFHVVHLAIVYRQAGWDVTSNWQGWMVGEQHQTKKRFIMARTERVIIAAWKCSDLRSSKTCLSSSKKVLNRHPRNWYESIHPSIQYVLPDDVCVSLCLCLWCEVVFLVLWQRKKAEESVPISREYSVSVASTVRWSNSDHDDDHGADDLYWFRYVTRWTK